MAKPGTVSLSFIWGIRLGLRAEGERLRAEGAKLRAEGERLWAEGDRLWAEGVIEAHGNIRLSWEFRPAKKACACVLETGETFEP